MKTEKGKVMKEREEKGGETYKNKGQTTIRGEKGREYKEKK